MQSKTINWLQLAHYASVVALVIGVLDPLEGSLIIVAGSIVLAIIVHLKHDFQRKLFLAAAIMIVIGVFFLFYFSSLGGFGGSSALSWWWMALIVPYPVGWLMIITLLIWRSIRMRRKKMEAKISAAPPANPS